LFWIRNLITFEISIALLFNSSSSGTHFCAKRIALTLPWFVTNDWNALLLYTVCFFLRLKRFFIQNNRVLLIWIYNTVVAKHLFLLRLYWINWIFWKVDGAVVLSWFIHLDTLYSVAQTSQASIQIPLGFANNFLRCVLC
jgi:hypothetical protein